MAKLASKTVTQTQFDTASEQMQNIWLAKGYEIVADDSVPSEPVSPVIKSEYSIEGDKVWLNQTAVIGTHKYRLPSTELTSIYVCQRGVKDSKERIDVPDVMALIDMVRTHGADVVNQHMTVESHVGKQGEASKPVDAIAELLAAK